MNVTIHVIKYVLIFLINHDIMLSSVLIFLSIMLHTETITLYNDNLSSLYKTII